MSNHIRVTIEVRSADRAIVIEQTKLLDYPHGPTVTVAAVRNTAEAAVRSATEAVKS